MKSIYIIQMHTGTFPARIVRSFTRYPYSHVGISLDASCNAVYSFGRKRLYNFLVGGFVKQRSTDRFYQRFKKVECRVFRLAVTDEQYSALQALLDGFEANEQRYHYDFCGLLLRELLHVPITFRDRYVCSHFVAEALERAGIYHFPRSPYILKPRDFEAMDSAEEVYCGAYPLG